MTDKYIKVLKPIVTSKGVHLILVEEILQPELNDQLRFQIGSELFGELVINQIEGSSLLGMVRSGDIN